ncbi:hypothetical protein TcasGA2_TC010313 [Tribolium castaneum]|uniref:Uncharacterized protein n=1 Tax=Tribolium castaneum TaxID=7070 RepID=D7EKJ8_TRICA|nr:hypothetical protein TcasGA2_TC010313 [Tribolium castaneum]
MLSLPLGVVPEIHHFLTDVPFRKTSNTNCNIRLAAFTQINFRMSKFDHVVITVVRCGIVIFSFITRHDRKLNPIVYNIPYNWATHKIIHFLGSEYQKR